MTSQATRNPKSASQNSGGILLRAAQRAILIWWRQAPPRDARRVPVARVVLAEGIGLGGACTVSSTRSAVLRLKPSGALLVALILTFGPISGAHFNPAVASTDASQGGLAWREALGDLAAHATMSTSAITPLGPCPPPHSP